MLNRNQSHAAQWIFIGLLGAAAVWFGLYAPEAAPKQVNAMHCAPGHQLKNLCD